ncbi:MAG: DUF3617 domain-containing protein [Pseudomonadota bacterium]|nr:DUF3617 domain-containing protein [Pseudomonadota bacterium]
MRVSPLLMLMGLAGLSTHALANPAEGLKPGLWETRVIKQVIDGRDLSGEMSAAMSEMKAALASMPPEQRAQMQAMMKGHGVASSESGALRICMSPEMAKRNALPVDKDGHCSSTMLTRTGNKMSYEFACNSNGMKTNGKGEATVTPNRVEMRTDATMQQGNGPRQTMHSETQMNFVSADCGDVKPLMPTK